VGATSTAEDAVRVDAGGGFLIPGLWDSHVHIFSTPDEPDTALPLYLINGITGIRDMGGALADPEQQALQARIEAGEVLGAAPDPLGRLGRCRARIVAGHVSGRYGEEARAVVAQVADEGWAAVKSYSMLDEATYLALAEAAEALGSAACRPHPRARRARHGARGRDRTAWSISGASPWPVRPPRSGCSTICGRDGRGRRSGAHLRDHGGAQPDHPRDLGRDLVRRCWRDGGGGMHVSPTLVVAGFYTGNGPPDAPRMRMLPPEVREAWGAGFPARGDDRRGARAGGRQHRARPATFLMAHAAGVPILASSDASFANPYLFHGFSLLDELDLYVEIGLTPARGALHRDGRAAALLRLADQDGTIAPGRRADLVLLDANPLEDLATLRHPRAVVAGASSTGRPRRLEAQLRAAVGVMGALP
jgi:hypothetical protein